MKKLLLIVGASTLFATNLATAQETVPNLTDQPCQTTYYTTRSDNWFIQIGAGMNMPLVENPGGDSRHITANYSVGVGKWFTPYFAWRFELNGGAAHWNSVNETMGKMNTINGNIDIMWDMFNTIGGVNTKRVFSIVPFVGLGATVNWRYRNDQFEGRTPMSHGQYKNNEVLLPVSAGLQLRFRLCKYVDFFAEGRMAFYGDSYNNYVVGRPVDMDLTVLGGFTFNLGGSEFHSFNPCDYTAYIDGANRQVNELRGELAETAAALAAANAQLPCPEVTASETVIVNEAAPLLATVRFTINSAKVTSLEKVNVYNVAEWMKANPDQNVVITGFADKDTGTANYNMALSQRRAQAVYDILVNEYGINPDRLAMVAAGSDTQLYNVNNWNRIVVFSVAE